MGQQIESALRQSMHRVLVVLVSFLPGVLVFLLAVILLTAFGLLLAAIVKRILVAARFDERIACEHLRLGAIALADAAYRARYSMGLHPARRRHRNFGY